MEKRKTARMTRRQVAQVLGVKVHEVAQMDGRELHPVRTEDRGYRYEAEEVGAVVSERIARTLQPTAAFEPDGPTTPAAFKLFVVDGARSEISGWPRRKDEGLSCVRVTRRA